MEAKMTRRIFSLFVISIFILTACGSDAKKTDYDVVVIGAGGGGLASAARLAINKKKVLLIEQHWKVGGYMGSFQRGDYIFEIGLHAMDGLDPKYGMNVQVFKDLDIYQRVKPIKMDPMYKVIYPSLTLVVPADPDAYIKLLIEKFPAEKKGIEDFYATMGRIFDAMNAGLLINRGEYAAGMWAMMKNPRVMGTLMYYLNSTMAEFLNEFFKDKLLIAAMTALTGMLGDGPDNISGLVFAAMWNSYHRGGYSYFEGGSQSVATALENSIKEHGGEIMLSTLVTKIIVEDGKVTGIQTKDGKTITCKYVVSNANAPDTFFKLVGEDKLDKDFVDKLKTMEVGAASFNLYIGVKKDFRNLFAGTSHQIIVNEFDDYTKIFQPMKDGDIEKVQFGIANYSNLESNIAPKGKNVISVVTLMPYDWNNGWRESEGPEQYKKLKEEVAKKLIARIEKQLPGLTANMEVLEVATPRTNEHFTLNYRGSIYGWANSINQSMLNRLPNKTPIKNLYLAGAWTFPAGGQSAVLMSGYTAAEAITKDMD
jgi:prolycopene isomerase